MRKVNTLEAGEVRTDSNPCILELQQWKRLMKGQKQQVFYDWMLKNGKSFEGRKLTEDEEKELQCDLSEKYTEKSNASIPHR